MHSTDDKTALDISECLGRVRSGDQAAARELMAHLQPVVLRTVRRHLPRRDSPEDLTQEIFMKMFCRLDQYHGAAPFTHWVSKITLRTCFDRLRAQRARPELRHGDLSESETEDVGHETLADQSCRPRRDDLEKRELLHLLLAQLNPDDRRVIEWFHLEEKSAAEICTLTGWNTEFVKMRIFRARRKLQRALTKVSYWDAPAGIRRVLRVERPSTRKRTAKITSIGIQAEAA